MSKKQWYVCTEISLNDIKSMFIQYVPSKKDAESLLKQVKSISKIVYIDFVWKSEVNKIPFSKLHGILPTKVDSIMQAITV